MSGIQEAIWFRERFEAIRSQVERVIVGQRETVEAVLVALATNGHVLLEGMPGVGKTLLVRTLAQTLDLQFGRIQFTPDLMPADVTGTMVLAEATDGRRAFEFRRGPVFTNLLLADEINRATPRTQSAMLEAMQERAVTVGGQRYELPEPFLVMATQNPIEQEGTYPLPEAQLDRFFFKLMVPYPTREELAQVVLRTTGVETATVEPVSSGEEILRMRQIVREVTLAEDVLDYALAIVMGTHPDDAGSCETVREHLRFGASPRGAQALIMAGRAYALLGGRFHVSKHDVRRAVRPALRHRIIVTDLFEITPDRVLDEVIAHADQSDRDPVRT